MTPSFLKQKQVRVILTVFLIIVAVLAAFGAVDSAVNKVFQPLDEKENTYFRETMKRSIYTYGLARGINGVISVIQGTDLAVSPVGVGVRLAVGQILDPVNDMVERFSWVMLISSMSLGIQKIFSEVSVWIGFRYLITIAMVFFVAGIWFPNLPGVRLRKIGGKLIIIALFIRFCMPISAIVGEAVYHAFLKEKYETSVSSLKTVERRIGDTAIGKEESRSDDANASWLDTLSDIFLGSEKQLHIQENIEALKEKISDYAKYLLDLIIVFVLQTIIIPIMSLWILFRIAGSIWSDSQGMPVGT